MLRPAARPLIQQLEYKAKWYGRTFIKVSRTFPSSALCFECGEVDADLMLEELQWTCPACGAEHDRDVNAAKNLKAKGLRLLGHPEDTGPVIGSPKASP